MLGERETIEPEYWKEVNLPEKASDEELVELFNQYKSIYKYA